MTKKKKQAFSDEIRAAVEGSDKTRYRIAQETGIDAAALCRFVQGQVGLSMDSLDRLAECIGLQVVMVGKTPTKRKTKKGR